MFPQTCHMAELVSQALMKGVLFVHRGLFPLPPCQASLWAEFFLLTPLGPLPCFSRWCGSEHAVCQASCGLALPFLHLPLLSAVPMEEDQGVNCCKPPRHWAHLLLQQKLTGTGKTTSQPEAGVSHSINSSLVPLASVARKPEGG